MNKKQYIVKLSSRQRQQLQDITKKGKHNARVITRARILLKSSEGWEDARIATYVESSTRTIIRVRLHFSKGGLDRALYDAPRTGQPPKIDDAAEAYLVTIACSDPPEGADHWTLELLRQRMIKDKKVKSISTVALWKRLGNRGIKPWREKNVVCAND